MKKSEEHTLINYRSNDPLWATWSMKEHSEDELRNAILYNPEDVCISYICRYSTLSEEFIEELICLSTGVFGHRPDLYTAKNRETLKQIMFIEPTIARTAYVNDIDLKNVEPEDKAFIKHLKSLSGNIRSKIDWWQIANYQKLSDDFKKRFANKFREARISEGEFDRA